MTRFARAKGSKSSNERVPNEATPWHVMKEQLEDDTTMKNDQTPMAKKAKELLSEKDQLYYYDSTGNVNNEWAEFDTSGAEKLSVKAQKKTSKPVEKSKKSKKISESETLGVETKNTKEHEENGMSQVLPKSTKNKVISESLVIENGSGDIPSVITDYNTIVPQKSSKKRKSNVPIEIGVAEDTMKLDEAEPEKTKKKKKRRTEEKTNSSAEPEGPKIDESSKSEEQKEDKSTVQNENEEVEKSETKATTGKISKRHKRNQKRISKNAIEKAAADAASGGHKPQVPISGGFDAAGNDWTSNVKFGKRGKNDDSKDSTSSQRLAIGKANAGDSKNRPNNLENNGNERKAPKIRDDKEHKRRKPDTGSIKCIINGFEVEIVKYDGFPVKKEDAVRLKELRKQMILKGIPKSEINVAMKLERRKAEKALSRVKKQVCFHCRKAGHNLSDCPELGDEESATGICFKCGSTEHTHLDCKVTKKEEFRFASCFICREQGHIAKQCPDNPKGLYPQGGACKICGDVTHLRKDCPDLTREKEETIVTLGTIAENSVESLDDDTIGTATKDESQKPKSKIVKF